MSEIKWIKINVDMYDNVKVRAIDGLGNGAVIINTWMKLLLLAGKCNDNGLIYMEEGLPFKREVLALSINVPMPLLNESLKILSEFKMVEVLEDGKIKISNWEKNQNTEAMEKVKVQNKERARRKRERDKLIIETSKNRSNGIDNVSNALVTEYKDIDKDKEIDIDKDIEKDIEKDSFKEAVMLLSEIEKKTGITVELSLSSLRLAISKNGLEYTRQAVSIAIIKKKIDMKYINGILKRWSLHGYPKLSENEGGSSGWNSEAFTGNCRSKLTEEERAEAECELI